MDKCKHGPCWLQDGRIAQIVADEIHKLDPECYRLLCYSILSNHVHLVIDTSTDSEVSNENLKGKSKNYQVTDTLRLLKGRTARYWNQALNRRGAFWHHESYDHLVCDNRELESIIRYCIENPVKADLSRIGIIGHLHICSQKLAIGDQQHIMIVWRHSCRCVVSGEHVASRQHKCRLTHPCLKRLSQINDITVVYESF